MSNVQSSMRTIYPTDEDYHNICRIDKSGKQVINVFVRPITEDQSRILNKGNSIQVLHNGREIELSNENCYATGNIDITDINDIELIYSFKWMNDRIRGFFIPRNYNYEDNSGDRIVDTKNSFNATIETFDNLKLFKFAYACIGKPKYVAIYGIQGIKRDGMD